MLYIRAKLDDDIYINEKRFLVAAIHENFCDLWDGLKRYRIGKDFDLEIEKIKVAIKDSGRGNATFVFDGDRSIKIESSNQRRMLKNARLVRGYFKGVV